MDDDIPIQKGVIVKLFRAMLIVPLLTSALLALIGAPSQALLPTGPGGSTCDLFTTHTQATSTTEKITLKLKCAAQVAAIEHNVTYMRDSSVIAVRHTYDGCVNNGAVPYTCAITYTASDPAGSQTFTMLDEWIVWWGLAGGTKTTGKQFGTAFTS